MELGMQNPASIMPRIEAGAVKRAGGKAVSVDRNSGKPAASENAQTADSRVSLEGLLSQLVGVDHLLGEYKTKVAAGAARDARPEEMAKVQEYVSQLVGEQQKAAARAQAMREQMAAKKETKESAKGSAQRTIDNNAVSRAVGNKRVH